MTYIASPADQYSFTPPYTEEKKATSTGHLSNHYWSLLVTSTTSQCNQYCSDHRPVLVDFDSPQKTPPAYHLRKDRRAGKERHPSSKVGLGCRRGVALYKLTRVCLLESIGIIRTRRPVDILIEVRGIDLVARSTKL